MMGLCKSTELNLYRRTIEAECDLEFVALQMLLSVRKENMMEKLKQ